VGRPAPAGLVARAGRYTLDADLALAYVGGRWHVSALVPPDFDTVFSPPPPPVSAPPVLDAAARTFALAYANYRTGAGTHPPAGTPTIERQIAARQDPLAAIAHTGAAARLLGLQLLPEGDVTPVDATVNAGGRRLAFTFFLQQNARGHWLAGSFPIGGP